ncbi:MAG: hypothetical protein M3Y39_10055 [Chloroflexota bacterium]|nr:hypothetical protein [Chloroflexota bacterium]
MMKTAPPMGEANARKRRRAIMLMALVLVLLLLIVSFIGSLFFKEYTSHLVSPPQVEWPDYLPLPTLAVVGLLASPMLLVLLGFYAFTLYNSTLPIQRIPRDEGAAEGASPVAPRPAYRRTSGCLTGLLALATVLGLCADGMLIQTPRIYDTTGTLYLDSVAMVSPQQAWAVGDFYLNAGGFYSVIEQYHNGQWTQMSNPARTDILRSLAMLPNGDAWAVGDQGVILQEHDGNWTRVASGMSDNLASVAMISPDEGWAVGGSYSYPIASNNVSMTAALAPLVAQVYPFPAHPRVVHDYTSCALLHYIGNSWTSLSCPTESLLASVSALADGEAWAVGDHGIILHEQNGTWTKMLSPTRADLMGVAMVSPREGWAVGQDSTLLHFTDGRWTIYPLPGKNYLDAITMLSPNEGWIAGDSMLHYSNGRWTQVSAPIKQDKTLFAIAALSQGDPQGWSMGSDNTVLQERQGVWSAAPPMG